MSWACRGQSTMHIFLRRADTWIRVYVRLSGFVLITVFILLFAAQSYAGQNDFDRWFAKDKCEHFALSAFYSAGIAKVAHRHFEICKDRSILIGAAITISLGALKEGVDYKFHKGRASYKDFIWDVAGTIVGALAADLTL
jgi:putative lipoprotein